MSIEAALKDFSDKLTDALGQLQDGVRDGREGFRDCSRQLGILYTTVIELRTEMRSNHTEVLNAVAALREGLARG